MMPPGARWCGHAVVVVVVVILIIPRADTPTPKRRPTKISRAVSAADRHILPMLTRPQEHITRSLGGHEVSLAIPDFQTHQTSE